MKRSFFTCVELKLLVDKFGDYDSLEDVSVKKRNKWFGTWTIMVMSTASSRVKTIKIPKLFVYLLTIFIFALSSSLYFSYKQNEQISSDYNMIAAKLDAKVQEYENLKEKHQTYLAHVDKTEKKIDALVSLEQDMDALLNGTLTAIGGEEVKIKQLSYSNKDSADIEQPELAHYQTVQATLPELVLKYKDTIEELKSVKQELTVIPSIWPTDSRRVTSQFGKRNDPFTRNVSHHNGFDIAGPSRSPIYATADGVVSFAGRDGGYGNKIELKHSPEYDTRYGHLYKILVKEGQQVKKGDLIGEMGTTGRSTGVHLHYEVVKNGERVDPLPYILIENK